MPHATLKTALRYNLDGVIYEKGVPHEVDAVTAVKLEATERFKITGLSAAAAEAAAEEIKRERPVGNALNEAIIDADAELDVDDESNYVDGKPTPAALSAILGYEVTADEIAVALGAQQITPPATPDELKEKVAARVKIKPPKAAAPAPVERVGDL